MSAPITISEAAVMLLIYDHESERNAEKLGRIYREVAALRIEARAILDRQIAVSLMVSKIKEGIA